MAAQALAVSAANAQESLTCVKCLVQLVRARAGATRAWPRWLRAPNSLARHSVGAQAVHQIAGLRGLFPDDAFKRRDIAGLPNVMELKARRCAAHCAPVGRSSARNDARAPHFALLQADHSPETRLVCDWIDRGAPLPALSALAAQEQPLLSLSAARPAVLRSPQPRTAREPTA